MELDIKPSKNLLDNNVNLHGDKKSYAINLYKSCPFGSVTIEEVEDLFRQRLEALAIIEKADVTVANLAVIAGCFREIKSYVYKTNCILLRVNDAQQKRLDQLSHMITRLYCIYQPNLWDWFKSCEKKLLYYRLRDQALSLSSSQLEDILNDFNFDFKRVVGPELSQLIRENLVGWNRRENDKELVDIFKVKFKDALRFIGKRSVSLKDGYAFLTRYEIMTVVCDVFERHLDNELQYGRQRLDVYVLRSLLDSLDIMYADFQEKQDEKRKTNTNNGDQPTNPFRIDTGNIEEAVKNHYPPCMRYMHESLTLDSHLKHQARLYYGAFLRSGGVDMDSAMEFWRKEFTKKIANDKFEREYKYNIRHLYGKEGHRKALSCFTCDKIINDNAPGPTDKHGCPFKHFDDTHLRGMLSKHGLKEADIESVVSLKNDKEYKLACSHYFKFQRGELPAEPIRNPIQFYYESMRLANAPPAPVKEEFEELEPDEIVQEAPAPVQEPAKQEKLEGEEEWVDD